MSGSQSGGIGSLWHDTESTEIDLPRLDGDLQADVAIIGAGYTGLAAAHRLALRGYAPVVLEANTIGWGASGRNGGVVSAKFRQSLPTIAKKYGLETARVMHHLCHQAVDEVESLIDDYGLVSAEFTRCGNLRCAHTARAFQYITEEAEWTRRELGDRSHQRLSAGEVAEETGSISFAGGVLSTGVGTLHPLGYVRGLADGLVRRHGQVLFEQTPVIRIHRGREGVRVVTPNGEVSARQVIMATNAYSELSPASNMIKSRLVPFRSSIIATDILPASLQAQLLVNGRSYGETRRMMRWFRKVHGRFVFGGRGAFGKNDSSAAFDALQRAMVSMFPELQNVAITHRWSGHVAMTLDALPHVGRFDDKLCYAAGYNGAGVAMSTLLGRFAADFAIGEAPEVAMLEASRLKNVPLYPLREFGIRLVAGWYQFLDATGR